MRLTRDFTYDAPVGQVLAMLRYPDFWDRVAQATGALSSSTEVTTTGDVVAVVTEQEQRVVGVPSFAKKFVGESTRAIIRQTWRGDVADYVVDTPGTPVSINGKARVAEKSGRTVLSYDLDVKCGVPLVGGKLEKLVGDLTGEGFDKEYAVGVAWLAGKVS